MGTVRRIRRLAAGTATICLLSAGLIASALAAPAHAVSGGAPGNPPVVTPPSDGPPTTTTTSGGGSYAAIVSEQVRLSGDVNSAGINTSDDGDWTPPPCWLQPEFHQPQTYATGDPSGGKTDADSFWWWFGMHYPGFGQFIHGTNSYDDINQEFQDEQNMKREAGWNGPDPITAADVWWGPNWLSGAAGWACVQGLLSNENLSDGFIGMTAPDQAPPVVAQAEISATDLSKIARAALKLPAIKVVTSPPAPSKATVNVPTYVSVAYAGNPEPTDTAEATWADGAEYLTATVTAGAPSVAVTTDAPDGSYTSTTDKICAEVNDKASPACSITFKAPSGGAGYKIDVAVTWDVTWTTNVPGEAGDFGPWTLPAAPTTIQVQEIQTIG